MITVVGRRAKPLGPLLCALHSPGTLEMLLTTLQVILPTHGGGN